MARRLIAVLVLPLLAWLGIGAAAARVSSTTEARLVREPCCCPPKGQPEDHTPPALERECCCDIRSAPATPTSQPPAPAPAGADLDHAPSAAPVAVLAALAAPALGSVRDRSNHGPPLILVKQAFLL